MTGTVILGVGFSACVLVIALRLVIVFLDWRERRRFAAVRQAMRDSEARR
jgi:hypothetical protein